MKKIVIKFGTSSLTNGTKKLSLPRMADFARQISQIHDEGHQILVVSSGAIATGRSCFSNIATDQSIPSKQMLASIGQVRLMQTWSELFEIYEKTIGQVLLTHSDLSSDHRRTNAQNTLQALLNARIIPIINENDTTATEEICFGDNDHLSALVAGCVKADLLILLTDQEGLYTEDPRKSANAKLLSRIEKIDEKILSYAQGTSKEGVGTGGMITKVRAAKQATEGGVETIIASSKRPQVLLDLMAGQKIGSFFAV